MKCYLDCVPCFLRQALQASRFVSDDPSLHQEVLRQVLQAVAVMDLNEPPPRMAQKIQAVIRQTTGNADPYLAVKEQFNQHAMQLLPALREKIEAADDPFQVAVRLAIAGNIIDFGPSVNVDEELVAQTIAAALAASFPEGTFRSLREAIDRADKILYLADNAGEIAFDRLLIEQLPREKVTLAVKGGPIINDAILADAEAVGLPGLVRVVENGSDAPGTILSICSESFRRLFFDADLILSKGQANYETLSEQPDVEIYFLLKAKCPVIARDIGWELGQFVVQRGKNTKNKAT